MFYSQDILQKRGGKFGVIWIAATKGTKLSKREYASVNLRRSCEDIICYITHEVPSSRRYEYLPRFSLYLSSLLMYGVCKVYKKQHDYLLSDTSTLMKKFRSMIMQPLTIDLGPKSSRPEDVTLEELPFLQHPGNPGIDLGFGRIHELSDAQLDDIQEIEVWKAPHSDSSPDVSKPPSGSPTEPSLSPPFQPDLGSPLQADPAAITMREDVQPTHHEIEIPGEVDLVPLETLMEEQVYDKMLMEEHHDEFWSDVPPVPEVAAPEPVLPEPVLEEQEKGIEAPESTTLENGALAPMEETPSVFIDPSLLEVDRRPEHREKSPDITPVQPAKRKKTKEDFKLSLDDAALDSPAIRRRKQQLLFADSETQLERNQLRLQLQTGEKTCKPMEYAKPEELKLKDMLNRPTIRVLYTNKTFLSLWKRNARTLQKSNEDSDVDHPIWTVPELGADTSSSEGSEQGPRQPLPPPDFSLEPLVEEDEEMRDGMEVVRDASLSNLSGIPTGLGDLTPHQSLHSVSAISLLSEGDSLQKSMSRKRSASSSLEGTLLEQTLKASEAGEQIELADIPEDLEQALEDSALLRPPGEEVLVERSPSPPAHHALMRMLQKPRMKNDSVTFAQICPPATETRKTAAKMFSALLDLCTLKKAKAQQDHPYADINITRGQGW